MAENNSDYDEQFGLEVKNGLGSFPKYLSSKYFYDDVGDKLFQQIMKLPEYYLSRCEYEILEQQKKNITAYLKGAEGFDLVELGAGDGLKTKILLRYWLDLRLDFKYVPIDISQHSLDVLENSLSQELPQLKVATRRESYSEALGQLSKISSRKKLIMVLGSNIGNLPHKQAIEFMSNIQQSMGKSDLLLMGFDQKKHPQVILDAYNDKSGITESFNKNLLLRINRELGGDFDIESFDHWPLYDPENGTVKSYLISLKKQSIHISKLKLEVEFKKYESILMEISQKYDDSIVSWLAGQAGLKIIQDYSDEKGYYKNYIFKNSGSEL